MKHLLTKILLIAVIFGTISCSKTEDFKLISYNIRNSSANDGVNSWENRKDLTVNMINQEKPDVIGMQEVRNDQLEFIYDELADYDYIGVGRDDGHKKGEYMAVFYRNDKFELLENGNFWLSETPDTVSLGWDGACRRMVTWGHFKNMKTGKMFFFFNTHLDHIGPVAREEAIKLIINRINEITDNNGEPVYLTGDFNATIDNPIFTPLINYMSQARKDAPVTDNKFTYTGYGLNPESMSVIDHIFYLNATPILFETLDRSYGEGYISDHYPVEAVFRVR